MVQAEASQPTVDAADALYLHAESGQHRVQFGLAAMSVIDHDAEEDNTYKWGTLCSP